MNRNEVPPKFVPYSIMGAEDSLADLQKDGLPSDAVAEMGTVIWIGPVDHPEFKDAFTYVEQTAAQLAVRRNQAELLQRPAAGVQQVVIARPRRIAILPAMVKEFQTRYQDAQVLLLNGALCDGERRSEQATAMALQKGFVQVRFSQWKEAFGIASSNGGHRHKRLTTTSGQLSFTLLLFDRYSDAEPLLQLARRIQVPALWARQFTPQALTGVQRVVWDESVAPNSPHWDWSKVIREAGGAKAFEHHWLVTQPQIDDISYAIRAGVCAVHGKPLWKTDFLATAD